jgi:hypothetical protein
VKPHNQRPKEKFLARKEFYHNDDLLTGDRPQRPEPERCQESSPDGQTESDRYRLVSVISRCKRGRLDRVRALKTCYNLNSVVIKAKTAP